MYEFVTYTQVHLGTYSFDELAIGIDALDEGNHSLGLRVVRVQVVVVDVQSKATVRLKDQ